MFFFCVRILTIKNPTLTYTKKSLCLALFVLYSWLYVFLCVGVMLTGDVYILSPSPHCPLLYMCVFVPKVLYFYILLTHSSVFFFCVLKKYSHTHYFNSLLESSHRVLQIKHVCLHVISIPLCKSHRSVPPTLTRTSTCFVIFHV